MFGGSVELQGFAVNLAMLFGSITEVKQTGIWKKLYMPDTGKYELPVPVAVPTKSPDDMEDEEAKLRFFSVGCPS